MNQFKKLYCLAVYAMEYNCKKLAGKPTMWGRHRSPVPMECNECGWIGLRKWMNHGYEYEIKYEDAIPCDYCPRCGAGDECCRRII